MDAESDRSSGGGVDFPTDSLLWSSKRVLYELNSPHMIEVILAFVACKIQDYLQHIFSVASVEVSLLSLLMSPLCLLVASFQSFSGGFLCFLVT